MRASEVHRVKRTGLLGSLKRLGVSCLVIAQMACGGSDDNNNDNDNDNDNTPKIDWAGTWTIQADYTASCVINPTADPNPTDRQRTTSKTLTVTGSNSGLTATVGGYSMSGTGSDTKVTLSGTFPLVSSGTSQSEASQSSQDTSITFTGSTIVSADRVEGTVTGQYVPKNNTQPCNVKNGTFVMTR